MVLFQMVKQVVTAGALFIGGFTGVMLGAFVQGDAKAYADFDWAEYRGE